MHKTSSIHPGLSLNEDLIRNIQRFGELDGRRLGSKEIFFRLTRENGSFSIPCPKNISCYLVMPCMLAGSGHYFFIRF